MFAELGGLKVPLGAGGTHISVTKQSFESNEEYIIEDWDVESYYPSLAIGNVSTSCTQRYFEST
jgi:hypothetical protein